MNTLLKTLIAVLLLSFNSLYAQNKRVTTAGIIEFEKSINMYAIVKKQVNKKNESFLGPAFEQYQKSQPQFKRLRSTLSFSGNQTLFTPEDNTENSLGGFFKVPMAAQNNIIFYDFSKNYGVWQKQVFENTFLTRDTIRHIIWKITNETREIAGYNCRRANALILDSVYVVAFYTDDIPVSGGPESFTGLPGMILGLALPHENISWFATKVTDIDPPGPVITTPSKGKRVSRNELYQALVLSAKNWGEYAQAALKSFLF